MRVPHAAAAGADADAAAGACSSSSLPKVGLSASRDSS